MKYFYSIFLILIAFVPRVMSQGDQMQAILDETEKLILTADAKGLELEFRDQVELTLLGNRKTYNRAQARYVMEEFFDAYPPLSFNFSHQGSTGDTVYALGEYLSDKGVFEVNIFIREVNGVPLVDEIRFDKK